MSSYFVADPKPQEIWGYTLEDGEKPVFVQCTDETEAREAVGAPDLLMPGIPHFRRLARRTLGPVVVVED